MKARIEHLYESMNGAPMDDIISRANRPLGSSVFFSLFCSEVFLFVWSQFNSDVPHLSYLITILTFEQIPNVDKSSKAG